MKSICRQSHLHSQRGVIMIGAFIITFFFLVVSLAAAEFGVQHYVNTRRTLVAAGALNAAEAGADKFMHQINLDSNYQGTNAAPSGTTDSCTYAPVPVDLVNNSVQGKVTYETCVKNGTIGNEKVILATGKVYLPASNPVPLVTRKLRLIITRANTAGNTIQTGPGGLNIQNNVSILSGPVYVGGRLTMANNSSIGSAVLPVDVYAEHVSCPTTGGSTYPVQCTGAPPYSISTANGVKINGNVYAKNGVDVPSRVTGTISTTVPHIDFPIIDHNTVTTAHAWTARSDNGGCGGGNTWAANTHFTGNVVLGNNCHIIVGGDIWIDGTLNLGNNSSLTAINGLTSQPKIIVDGYDYAKEGSVIMGNNVAFKPNSAQIGFQLLTYYSFNAAGNGPSSCNPGCTTLAGSELFASQGKTTIELENNFSSAVGTLLYSRWSGIIVENNATIGQIMAQRIDLSNGGSIVFDLGGSPGTASGWDVRYYEQVYQ